MNSVARAHIVHQMENRTRIRFPNKESKDFFRKLPSKLQKCKAIKKIELNPTSGTALIFHSGDFKEVEKFSEDEGLFTIMKEVEKIFPSQPDLSKPLATGIVLLGVIQMLRNQWLPPAWTLFSEAFLIYKKFGENQDQGNSIWPEIGKASNKSK